MMVEWGAKLDMALKGVISPQNEGRKKEETSSDHDFVGIPQL